MADEGKKPSFDRSLALTERLHRLIPGGAHTYAKGDDQYPADTPPILVRGEGAASGMDDSSFPSPCCRSSIDGLRRASQRRPVSSLNTLRMARWRSQATRRRRWSHTRTFSESEIGARQVSRNR